MQGYGMEAWSGGSRAGMERQGEGGGAVAQQPALMGFSSPASAQSGAPSPLGHLFQVDQLRVKQDLNLYELFGICETNNKYSVCDTKGQQLYMAHEDTNWFIRQCCGPTRPFDIKLLDGDEREVLHLSRPLRSQSCCCPCWLQRLEVSLPGGQLLGTVRQRWSLLKPKLTVHTADDRHVFTIRGPFCQLNCCADVVFHILTADTEREVGAIRKQWSGLLNELVTDSDKFSVSFSVDLDVNLKAILLGAMFLVDFMYFESSH